MKIIFYLFISVFIMSACTGAKVKLETGKIYEYKLKSQPIVNRVELTPREYRLLDAVVDTMNKDLLLKVNIISYRDQGYYDTKNNEHCSISEDAFNYLMEKGVIRQRITFAFGRPDYDNQIGHMTMAEGVSSGGCTFELQIYYPKKEE